MTRGWTSRGSPAHWTAALRRGQSGTWMPSTGHSRVRGYRQFPGRRERLAYWTRSNRPASGFGKETLEWAPGATVERLAIAPERLGAIESANSARLAAGRAACVAVRVPEEIRIFHSEGDGPELLAARLHETGHAHHLAWTSAALPG